MKPIIEKTSDFEKIEDKINKFFLETIYMPAYQVILKNFKVYLNSPSHLINAIIDNKVQYTNGGFYGKFNSKISLELRAIGASWSHKLKSYRLPEAKLPMDVRQAVAYALAKVEKLHEDINKTFGRIDIDEELKKLNLEMDYKKAINGIEKDYQAIAKAASVEPSISEGAAKNIAEKYAENMKLYIKTWSEKNILKLREQVKDNFNKGARAESLVGLIQTNYKTSKNKARFLARQETSLLTAEYTVNRYKDMGSTKWKWSSSHDSDVRDLHRHLDGQIFTYDNPPVIDERTGQKGFPRQAFGCRCKMVALVQ